MTELDDAALRAALAPARTLEPADHEVAAAIIRARTTRPPSRRLDALAVALVALVVLACGAYTVPATRAAIQDVADSFSGWLAGEDDGPGRPAPGDAPAWVLEGEGRMIAETAGVPLYVTTMRVREGRLLGFALGRDGTSIAAFDTVDGWRARFEDHALMVLGTLPVRSTGAGDRYPVLGVTARDVERVELRYAEGPPAVATGVDGGFVLMVDPTRAARDVVAYDAGGQELERTDLGGFVRQE